MSLAKDQLAHSPQSSESLFEELSPLLISRLRSLTPARVALKRTGESLATSELLDFQLAQARARDAVHSALQPAPILAELGRLSAESNSPILLHSAAKDRQTYLQRPDLGRTLDSSSHERLRNRPHNALETLAICLVDGLSALAVERHALPLLAELLAAIETQFPELHLAPISVVEQGRVAIGDEIGELQGASLIIVLIGERPGLSSPDSLGAYITWQPRPGRTDAERNCISNIRSEGLSYKLAADRLLYYIRESRRLQLTGVALKDADSRLLAGGEV